MGDISITAVPDASGREIPAQDAEALFERALTEFGPAISRIVRANEARAPLRSDLQQEIYLELWRSLAIFDGRCSLGTWVYRIALNMTARPQRHTDRTSIAIENIGWTLA